MEKNPGPDNISESSETIFRLNILKFFSADPDQGSLSGMEKFVSGINIPIRNTELALSSPC
jgi:hypothetical protein